MIGVMQIFNSRFGRVMTIATISLLLLSVYVTGVEAGVDAAFSMLPTFALLSYIVFLVFWLPRVEIDEGGVRFRNIFNTVYISWAAINRIDTKWALTIFTSDGKYTAWSASAPGRHSAIFATKDQGSHLPESSYLAGTIRPGDLITSDSGAPAAVIRRIWESKRDQAGIASVSRKWNIPSLILLGLLLAIASVL
jgi:hypothetical protein